MATKENQQSKGSEEVEKKWLGSVRKGKLWCDCTPPGLAKARTITSEGPDKGQRFWICPKDRNDSTKCRFFIFMSDQAEAMEWLKEYGPEEPPETPPPPKSPETPWTKSKRRLVLGEVSNEGENGRPLKQNDDDDQVYEQNDEGSPSRKAARTEDHASPRGRAMLETIDAALLTPGDPDNGKGKAVDQSFQETLEAAAAAVPTPETLDKGKGKATNIVPLFGASSSSNTTTSKNNHGTSTGQEIPDLAARVLDLFQEENHRLKSSTKLMIIHEIEGELEQSAARVRGCERTIQNMTEMIRELEKEKSELEQKLFDWAGGDTVDEDV